MIPAGNEPSDVLAAEMLIGMRCRKAASWQIARRRKRVPEDGKRGDGSMQHIVIRKFGPIREIDMDLDKKMEVIIGPQASGKSTFSKVVYFCKKVRDYFLQYLDSVMNTEYLYTDELYVNFLKYIRRLFMGYFGTTKHMEPFEIKYFYETETNRYIKIVLDDDRFAKISFSHEMRGEISGMIEQAVIVAEQSRQSSFAEYFFRQAGFLEKIRAPIHEIFRDDDRLIYVPAGRNLLAVVPDTFGKKKASIQNHMGDGQEIDISQIDLITQEFIRYISDIRSDFGSRLDEITQNYLKTVKGQIRNHDVELACTLIRRILRADYICDRDGEKLFYDNEHWVKLMFGSSGQQEILWALNIIFMAILKNEKTFLVFEEPESHLFPDSQETIAELAALLLNSSNSRIIITTHSPYMLTAANLLIYSGEEEGRSNGEDVVVRKELRLQPGAVGAHFLSPDAGRMENIIGKRKGLIDALAIDGLSASINERMDKILQSSFRNRGNG